MRLLPIFLCFLTVGCDLIPRSHLERVQHEEVLRVLTRNSATTYYEGSFGPAGLEYDLVRGLPTTWAYGSSWKRRIHFHKYSTVSRPVMPTSQRQD